MSMPLLKLVITSNYADSDITLPPSRNDFLAAFNPACPATRCAVQTATGTLAAPQAVGDNREQFGLHPPSLSSHSMQHTWQKDQAQPSQQLDGNAATNATDLKPRPQKNSPNIANFLLIFPGRFQSVCLAGGILCKEAVKIPAIAEIPAPAAAAWRFSGLHHGSHVS